MSLLIWNEWYEHILNFVRLYVSHFALQRQGLPASDSQLQILSCNELETNISSNY
jgi:hypothetical protein